MLTTDESANEAADGQDGHMHLLVRDEETLICRLVPVTPKSIDSVPNVTSGIQTLAKGKEGGRRLV